MSLSSSPPSLYSLALTAFDRPHCRTCITEMRSSPHSMYSTVRVHPSSLHHSVLSWNSPLCLTCLRLSILFSQSGDVPVCTLLIVQLKVLSVQVWHRFGTTHTLRYNKFFFGQCLSLYTYITTYVGTHSYTGLVSAPQYNVLSMQEKEKCDRWREQKWWTWLRVCEFVKSSWVIF